MCFYDIDFLSSPPQTFIFEKPSNKNWCGRICSLIILIGITIISILFIVKNSKESNYSISYTYFIKDMNEPFWGNKVKFNYGFKIYNFTDGTYQDLNLSNNFKLCSTKSPIPYCIKKSKNYEKNIEYFNYDFLYECKDDSNCQMENNIPNYFYLFLYLTFEEIDYQRENPNVNRTYIKVVPLSKNQYRSTIYNFKKILFTDVGFFNSKNYTFLSIDDSVRQYDNNKKYLNFSKKNHINLGNIRFEIRGKGYEEKNNWTHYKRTKNTIFTAISDICAISQVFYAIINFSYTYFFSNHYDNYNIFRQIFIKEEKKFEKNIIQKSIQKNIQKNIYSQTSRDNLINNENQDDNIINNDTLINNGEQESPPEEKNHITLPGSNCLDFIFSAFACECRLCCRCCIKGKNIDLIRKCNERIAKFYSIDKIIYNQILLENMIKDYKWNNKNLMNVENNESMISLINCIKSLK